MNMTGEQCPCCFHEFENGDVVMVFGCGGNHFLCQSCEREVDCCPMCRGDVSVSQICEARVYHVQDGTAGNPIVIVDDDED